MINPRYFSLRGRIARSHYWFFYVIPFLIVGWFAGGDVAESGGIVSWAILLVLVWLGLAGVVKRLHDIDYSLWWLVGAAACSASGVWLSGISEAAGWVVGGGGALVLTWLSFLMYFFRGTRGDNRFGTDPLEYIRGF
jgi:uncharacterized membrane protein YhaH (DUF805 family)